MNKKSDKTLATKKAFIDAYCTLVNKKDETEISIKEITDLAGYNRTTFYRYFSDIIAVREYLENEMIEGILDNIRENIIKDFFDDSFFELFLEYCMKYKTELLILTKKSNQAHFIDKIICSIKPIFESVYNSSIKTDIVMTIYLTGVFSSLEKCLRNSEDIDKSELLKIIRDLFEKWFIYELKNI